MKKGKKPVQASSNFYAELPSFSDFSEFTNDSRFVRAPDDWFVVITDVRGSTKLIDAGRYKDVNMIGAASISVVAGLLKEDFPHFFGGDGATMLIPASAIDGVLKALQQLQYLSLDQYQMNLRVGRITVGETRRGGHVIEVARHEMAAGKYAAVFRGDGLEEAEKRIKSDEPKYCCQADGAGGMEMPGLAWRWSSLPHRRGQIMSLLVQAKSEPHGKVYDEFLEALGGIFKGRLDDANPVNLDWRRYDDIADCLRDEYRFPRDRVARSRLARLVERATIRLKYRLKAFNLGPTHYDDSMRTHADHSKFDGTLRMLLDCSDHEMVQIHAYLEMRRAVGELCYGMHLADTAVMMCYASDLKNDPHTHFIDGGGGGYAMAARQLKQQLHVNAPVIDLQPRPAEPAPEAPEAGEPETSKKPTAPNFA